MAPISEPAPIAFFGATGGCTAVVLAATLKAGFKASALARTPSKISSLLREQHEVPAASISAHLRIVQGNVLDQAVVREVLCDPSTRQRARLVVFGIGATPNFQLNPLNPVKMDDPHVCANGMQSVIRALRSLADDGTTSAKTRPLVTCISTTGVSKKQLDVPYLLYPLYHWLLATPHEDKAAMEMTLVDEMTTERSAVQNYVFVRPTLLTDGPAQGLDKVRVGWEWGGAAADKNKTDETAPGPAKGYSISRKDVGSWIFEEVVAGKGNWAGKAVSLTY